MSYQEYFDEIHNLVRDDEANSYPNGHAHFVGVYFPLSDKSSSIAYFSINLLQVWLE